MICFESPKCSECLESAGWALACGFDILFFIGGLFILILMMIRFKNENKK
jgi:hypothetical protein